MTDLSSTFGACGYDPSYEKITIEAMKRGRNGDGRAFEVDVLSRSGEHLGVVPLRGGDSDPIADTLNQVNGPYEDRVEVLGQVIADLLVNKLAEQKGRTESVEPSIFTKI